MPDPTKIEALLDHLTSEGMIPQGASGDEVYSATLAGLDSAGYKPDHPWTQSVANSLRSARVRQTIAAKGVDPANYERLRADVGGQSPEEVARRLQATQQDGSFDAIGSAYAQGNQGAISAALSGVPRTLRRAASGLAGIVGADQLATEERMLSEARMEGAIAGGHETAAHIGDFAGYAATAPVGTALTLAGAPAAAAGAVALGAGALLGAGETASQIQDLGGGRIAQTTGAIAGGGLSLALPLGAAKGAGMLGQGIAKSAIGQSVRTAAEAVGMSPRATMIGGQVLITGAEGAVQGPAGILAQAGGLLFGGQAGAALETAKNLLDPVAAIESAVMHGGAKTLGHQRMAGSLLDPRAQGNLLEQASVPYMQPEIAQRTALRREQTVALKGAKARLAQAERDAVDRKNALDMQREAEIEAAAQQQGADNADFSADMEARIRAQAQADAADTAETMGAVRAGEQADLQFSDKRAGWREEMLAARKQADDEQAAIDLRLEQEAQRREWEAEQARQKQEWEAEQARLDAEDQARRDAVAEEALRVEMEAKRRAGVDAAAKLAAEQRLAALEADIEGDRLGQLASEDAAEIPAIIDRLGEQAMSLEKRGLPSTEIDREITGYKERLRKVQPLADAFAAKQAKAEALRRRLGTQPALPTPPEVPAPRQRPAPPVREMPAHLREAVPEAAPAPRPAPSVPPSPEPVARADAPAAAAEPTPAAPEVSRPAPSGAAPSGEAAPGGIRAAAPEARPADFVRENPSLAPRVEAAATSKATGALPSAEAERAAAPWKAGMGGYSGHKQESLATMVQRVEESFGAEAEKIHTVEEPNGGSGMYGVSLVMASPRLKNANTIRIGEYDPDQHAAIRLVHDAGDQVGRLMARHRVFDAVEPLRLAIDAGASAGGVAGRLRKALNDGTFREATGEQRALLKLVQNWSRNNARGERSMQEVIDAVSAWAAEGKKTVDAFKARGGRFEYLTPGDAYPQLRGEGPEVLHLGDPPYYGTAGYGWRTTVADYKRTRDALHSAARRGNSILYNDEAWWTKEKAKNEKGTLKAELREWPEAVPVLESIHGILDSFTPHHVASRTETVGVRNGFRAGKLNLAGDDAGPGRESEGAAVPRQPDTGGEPGAGRAADGLAGDAAREGAGVGVVTRGEGRYDTAAYNQPSTPRSPEVPRKAPAAREALTPDEVERIREAAAEVLGSGVRAEVQADGSVKLISRAGEITAVPLTGHLPPEAVNKKSWLASVRQHEWISAVADTLKRAGYERISPKRLADKWKAESVARDLENLPPELWAKLVEEFPVKGVSYLVGGADGARLIGLDRDLMAGHAPNKLREVVTEEVTEHVWKALVSSDPTLAAEIIEVALPGDKALHLDASMRLRDGHDPETVEAARKVLTKALLRVAQRGGFDPKAPVPTGIWGRFVAWWRKITGFLNEVGVNPADKLMAAHMRGEGPLQSKAWEAGKESYSVGRKDSKLRDFLASGEDVARGVLHHPEVGDIDLRRGEAAGRKSIGWGVAKLERWHPEALDGLDEALPRMEVMSHEGNTIQLSSDDGWMAVVKTDFKGEPGNWLLTAYHRQGTETPPSSVGKPQTDSSGRLIHTTQEGRDAFWHWFGDSITVDAEGRPKVFYHGTSKDVGFKDFSPNKRGHWFTSNPDDAAGYAKENDSRDVKYEVGKWVEKNTADRVIPVYLRVVKPMELTDAQVQRLRTDHNYAKAQREVFAQRGDADGYIAGDTVVVFDSKQVKSATGNRGTFGKAERNITYSVGRKMDEGEREANFRRWFGDSKLKDAEGRPFTLYHGTPEAGHLDFRTGIGKMGEGIYLGGKHQAGGYAHPHRAVADGIEPEGAAGVYPLHARIENPFYTHPDEMSFYLERIGWDGEEAFTPFLKSKGYDGVIATNTGRPPKTQADIREVLVFASKQIKSATGNKGAFDPADPRITYSVGRREGDDAPLPKERTHIEVDGEQRSTINSNSRPLGKTVGEVKNFWRWFGASPFVDLHGRPKVFYHHGSFDAKVDPVFRVVGGAHFGTKDAAMWRAAGKRAEELNALAQIEQGEDGRWYWDAGHLEGNPDGYESRREAVSDMEWAITEEGDHSFDGNLDFTEVYLRGAKVASRPDAITTDGWKEAIRKASRHGYEAIRYVNKVEDPGSESVVVFDPRNIKSATDNKGTFDPADPRITYSVGKRDADSEAPEGVDAGNVALAARRWMAKDFGYKSDLEGYNKLADDFEGDANDAVDMLKELGADPKRGVAAMVFAERQAEKLYYEALREGGREGRRRFEAVNKIDQATAESLTAAAHLMRASQRDVRKPEYIRTLVRRTLMDSDSPRWQRLRREAAGDEAKLDALFDRQMREVQEAADQIKRRTGIDILAEDFGSDGDTYSVGILRDMIVQMQESKLTMADKLDYFKKHATIGQLVAEIVRGNILTVASPVPQLGQGVYFLAKSGANRVMDSILSRAAKDPSLSRGGKEGVREAVSGAIGDIIEGFKMAVESQRVGKSLVYERLLHLQAEPGETQTSEGGKALLPWQARTLTGPGAVMTGIVDDMTWFSAFRMRQRFEARRLGVDLEDPRVMTLAKQAADHATFRGEYEGMVERTVGALGGLRSPVMKDAEGNLKTNWLGLVGYGFLPIFKSMVKGLNEGVSVANIPHNVFTAGKKMSRLRSGSEHLSKEAEHRKVSLEQVRDEHYRAAVEAAGRTLLGSILLTAGFLLAKVPSGTGDTDEDRVRQTGDQPGTLGGVPFSRFSPSYEPTQIAGILRDAIGRGATMDSASRAIGGLYDALLNRPLLGSLPVIGSRAPKDVNTGEPMSVPEQAWTTWAGHASIGKFYSDAWRRAHEDVAHRPEGGVFERNYALDRDVRHSPFGQERNNGGFFRKLLFGGEGSVTEAESAVARRIVKLNEAATEGVKDPALKRHIEWWSAGRLPTTEQVGKVPMRYSADEQDELRRIAGEAFLQMAQRIPESAKPEAQLKAMKQAWSFSVAMARKTVAPQFIKRIKQEGALSR